MQVHHIGRLQKTKYYNFQNVATAKKYEYSLNGGVRIVVANYLNGKNYPAKVQYGHIAFFIENISMNSKAKSHIT